MNTYCHPIYSIFRTILHAIIFTLGIASILATTSSTSNQYTIACATAKSHVRTGSLVVLDARCTLQTSLAPDDDYTIYNWSILNRPAGSAAWPSEENTVNPSFIADKDGIYTFQLRTELKQTFDTSSTTTITITAHTSNAPPIAEAGPHQETTEGETIFLNANRSFDADDDNLSYLWSFKTPNTGLLLDDVTSATPSFIMDLNTTVDINLVVNDGSVDSEPNTVRIISRPNHMTTPVAVAGSDQYAATGTQVNFNGSQSYSVVDNPLIYNWRLISCPYTSQAVLVNTGIVAAGFIPDIAGSYLVELEVDDGYNTSESHIDDIIQEKLIIIVGNGNVPPVADGGPDYDNAITGDTIQLNGSASYDSEDASLQYDWYMVKQPANSSANLPLDNIQINFTPDVDGIYLIALRVHDGTDLSAPDVVRITASTSGTSGTPLSVETDLPYKPSDIEASTYIQVDATAPDTVKLLSSYDSDALNPFPAIMINMSGGTNASFYSNTEWTMIDATHVNPVNDTQTPTFIVQRISDGLYYKFTIDFTVVNDEYVVQIDGLSAWRCGVSQGGCP